MRLKLEYFILGLLVVAASLYLLLREKDRLRYKLPALEQIDTEAIDRIEVERKGERIELVKSADQWKILPEGHRADPQAAREMVTTIRDLSLTDLLSVSKAYDRYGLSEESRIRVTALGGQSVLRRFDIGSTARAYQHTYITLADDARIFHAKGNIRSTFDRSREELRDKLVLSFDASTIFEIEMEKNDESVRLIRAVVPLDTETTEQDAAKRDSTRILWKTPTAESWDTEKVERLLNQLSHLRCLRYLEEAADLTRSLFSIAITGDKKYRLAVFQKKDSTYPGLSSQSESPFLLSSYTVEEIAGILQNPEGGQVE
jgi:hypothetical protein